jgi:RimJ/RimL family protein N-acetyltransferase
MVGFFIFVAFWGGDAMKNGFIVGERIYLRPLELDDLERCQRWINDPEVNRYLVSGRFPINRLKEEEWLRSHYKSDRDVIFAICLKDGNEHIGNCGLHFINWIDRNAVLGIMIGEKREWNKGYGTEAVKLLLKYAFDTLNLERVELTVFDYNKRGIKAYEKAGFKVEGRLRRKRFKDGRYFDEIVMAILKGEWEG